MLDHAAQAHPIARAALLCASIVTAAAVLRACGRIFLGWGPREPDAPGGGEPDEEPETEPAEIPWSMWMPAALLLALGLFGGLAPHLHEGAERAAVAMLDPEVIVAWVLHGSLPPQAQVPPAPSPSVGHALMPVAAAVALALLTLFRKRLPRAMRKAIAVPWSQAMAALRGVHTGEVGDQVAWLTFGLALLGGVTWLLR
jgi:multicomponent Na+:H+ antiporter subunit D